MLQFYHYFGGYFFYTIRPVIGRLRNTLNYYFSDEKRFADLFNGVFFQGKPVVEAQELSEASEVYHQPDVEKPKTGIRGKRVERIHDVCKKLKSTAAIVPD